MYPQLYNSFVQQQRYRFNGQIPLINSTIGPPRLQPVNCLACDFNQNYRGRIATEWGPLQKTILEPPSMVKPFAIYYTNIGMMPNYGGHVPGATVRFGKTFGKDTTNAKRFLKAGCFE